MVIVMESSVLMELVRSTFFKNFSWRNEPNKGEVILEPHKTFIGLEARSFCL